MASSNSSKSKSTNQSTAVVTSVSYTLLANEQNLSLTGNANLTGIGNDLDNVINGNDGNNTIDGLKGTDILKGGKGNDTYIVDLDYLGLDLYGFQDRVEEKTGVQYGTQDTIIIRRNSQGNSNSPSTLNLLNNIENLDASQTQSLTLFLNGNKLNNTLIGNDADNRLDGKQGIDILIGGLGGDTYFVDNLNDVVTEYAGEGLDSVALTISKSNFTYVLPENVEILYINGKQKCTLIGNDLDNTITGNAASNIIDGKGGVNVLYGWSGNDTYIINTNTNIIIEEEGSKNGIDLVKSTVSYKLAQNIENLSLEGSADISGFGNGLNNKISGNTGNNVLNGGLGNDLLTGGSGKDVFVFNSTLDGKANLDTITDFQSGVDVIKLDPILFLSLINKDQNSFASGAKLKNSTDQNVYLTYNTKTGTLYYDADANGKGEAIAVAKFKNKSSLTFSDFQFDGFVTSDSSLTLSNADLNGMLTGSADVDLIGNQLNNNLIGNVGSNLIDGMGGDDVIYGLAGSDIIDGGTGNDCLVGGDGVDLFVLSTAPAAETNFDVISDYKSGEDFIGFDVSVYTALIGRDFYNFNWFDNVFGGLDRYSAHYNSVLLTSNNTLYYDADGGKGGDPIPIATLPEGLVADDVLLFLSNSQFSNASYVMTNSDINLQLEGEGNIDATGNSQNNILIGNHGNNDLTGLAGNDVLAGFNGNDILDGGLGADSMRGGLGDDIYYVDNVGDEVLEDFFRNDGIVFYENDDNNHVFSSVSYTIDFGVADLTLTGTDNINGYGHWSKANTIIGNDGNNIIDGGLLRYEEFFNLDYAFRGGEDTLIGGKGDDTYYVYGYQSVIEYANEGIDTMIYANESTVLQPEWIIDPNSEIENFSLLNDKVAVHNIVATNKDNKVTGNNVANLLAGQGGDDLIYGLGGNDRVGGGLGSDILIGGAGDDYLIGNEGKDTLTGDSGNDTFAFDGFGIENVDTVVDFVSGQDKIAISLLGGLYTGLYSDMFVTSTVDIESQSPYQYLIYNQTSGNLFFDSDANGSNQKELIANFGANTVIKFSDFTNAVTVSGANIGGGLNVIGTSSSDILTGGNFKDFLYGYAGDDFLVSSGNDVLKGGEGGDVYAISSLYHDVTIFDDGTSGIDEIRYSALTSESPFSLLLSSDLYGIERVVIGTGLGTIADTSGTASLNVWASFVNNALTIVGNSGDNRIIATAYDDNLQGGVGNDVLTGYLGADTFKWSLSDKGTKGSPSIDSIADFNYSENDKLDLRDLLVGEHSSNTSDILRFIDIVSDTNNTELRISNTGGFSGGVYSSSEENAHITLANVNLLNGTNELDLLQNMVSTGRLMIDA
jgi:Ca2+-binding RTX toxin-like protein